MPVAFLPSLLVTDSEKLVFPFLFELAKSFLDDGHHVHLITKNKIEDFPLTFDKSEDPCVDSLSRLSIKYLENAQQLVDYAIDLQLMLSRQGGKPPKAVIIQGLQNYFDNENYGDMALALLMSALKCLSRTMNFNVNLIAGFEVHSNKTSKRIMEFLENNFFKRNWHMSVKDREGVIKTTYKCQNYRIKFTVENGVVFMNKESFLKYFKIPEH